MAGAPALGRGQEPQLDTRPDQAQIGAGVQQVAYIEQSTAYLKECRALLLLNALGTALLIAHVMLLFRRVRSLADAYTMQSVSERSRDRLDRDIALLFQLRNSPGADARDPAGQTAPAPSVAVRGALVSCSRCGDYYHDGITGGKGLCVKCQLKGTADR